MAALELEWALGINSTVQNCVHLFSNNSSSEEIIFYPISNNGVIYNTHTKEQTFLSLHSNVITSSILSSNKELLILGDSGASNHKCLISIWNASNSFELISKCELPPNFGIQSMAINSENTLLSAIVNESENNSEIVQHLLIWSLSKKYTTFEENNNNNSEDTIIECKLLAQHTIQNKNESYHFITFNTDSSEIVTHGQSINNFIFWSLNESELSPHYYSPLTDNANNIDLHSIGNLTASTFFHSNSHGSVLTATDCGDLIVWHSGLICKIITKISRGSINHVSILKNNKIIVIISSVGSVRFYDFEFRVIGWLNYLGDSLTSVSFPLNIRKYQSIKCNADDFRVPNMIIGTANNKIIKVCAAEMDEECTHSVIVNTFNTVCTTMSAHPTLPLIAVGTNHSQIQIWDISTHSQMQSIDLKNNNSPKGQTITDVCFSPTGECIVFGTDLDYLRIYDCLNWEEMQSFKSSFEGNQICNLCFSNNGEWFALSQSNRISVYRKWFAINDLKKEKCKEWLLIGSYESHNQCIKSIHFSNETQTDIPRLFSVSSGDHLLNEYNLKRSSANFGLRIKYTFLLKQRSAPTNVLFVPSNESREDRLLVFDDENKMHFYHSPRTILSSEGRPIYTADSQRAKSATNKSETESEKKDKETIEPITFRQTVIGPSFGAPIQKVAALDNEMKSFLFCTHDQVIGLMESPFNGNPNRYFGCIAHPGRISGFEMVSFNNDTYLVTNGGFDKSLLLWKINRDILSRQIMDCDESKNLNRIFSDLIDECELEQIRDYFTYVQIENNHSQMCTVPRSISNQINMAQITSIFQGMGAFLAQNEIERMEKEIKYRFGNGNININLNQFIQLFVNYRPMYEMSLDRLNKAFENSMNMSGDNREYFLEVLQKKGEKMSRDELFQCLESLTGYDKKQLSCLMPKKISPRFFTQQILGLTSQNE